MFPIIRAVAYASLFVAAVLFFLPMQILQWAGIQRPAQAEWLQVAGILVAALGLGLALWCVLTFAVVGRGTPAPFDPPRRLVVRGPYRFVRNPMYLGAAGALTGAAVYFETWWLAGFAGGFFLVTHLFVVLYEEPTLHRTFGDEYRAYRRAVNRWWPSPKGLKIVEPAERRQDP